MFVARAGNNPHHPIQNLSNTERATLIALPILGTMALLVGGLQIAKVMPPVSYTPPTLFLSAGALTTLIGMPKLLSHLQDRPIPVPPQALPATGPEVQTDVAEPTDLLGQIFHALGGHVQDISLVATRPRFNARVSQISEMSTPQRLNMLSEQVDGMAMRVHMREELQIQVQLATGAWLSLNLPEESTWRITGRIGTAALRLNLPEGCVSINHVAIRSITLPSNPLEAIAISTNSRLANGVLYLANRFGWMPSQNALIPNDDVYHPPLPALVVEGDEDEVTSITTRCLLGSRNVLSRVYSDVTSDLTGALLSLLSIVVAVMLLQRLFSGADEQEMV